MPYEWSSDLETGNSIIDSQHKALFVAVNNFSDAYRNGKGTAEIEQTLSFLVEYCIQHFHDEEELQKKYNFPYYTRHKQDHNNFKKTVLDLIARFKEEGPTNTLMDEIYLTIVNWLVHHIKSDDFVLAAFIRDPD